MLKNLEEVINDNLKDDAHKNALDFIAHLRRCEDFSISMDENDDGRWWIRCKDNLVCEIQIEASGDYSDNWQVWFYGDYIGGHDSPVGESIKKIAWANITFCRDCGAGCAPGKRKTVFGKDIDNICQSTLGFSNPDPDKLDCMKKIVDTIKND